MASSTPIPPRKGSSVLDIASSFASSFRVGSQNAIVHDIIARDLAEYSDDEDSRSLDHAFRDEEDSDAEENGPTLYRQPVGIAFGYRRPSLLPEPMEEYTVLTRAEKQVSRDAERSLLRDNHLLPPKHGVEEGEPGLLRRMYKHVFSTKVRQPPRDEDTPRIHVSETSPLLPNASAEDANLEDEQLDEQWDAAVASGKLQTTWQREAKTVWVFSRSLIVTYLLQYSVNIASIFAVGHIGKIELGAVSLATMTANITCYAPFQGLATSLDTLCAQAYGCGRKQLVGLHVQKLICFLSIMLVPVAVLWVFAGDILRHIIPEARAAELAGLYLKIIIAGLPGFIALEGIKRFLTAQGLMHAMLYVLLVAAPFSYFTNWLFVWHFGWGYVGAPIAVALTQNLIPVLLVLYVVFVDGSQCWGGFTKKALTNWGDMIRLAVPGMIMILAEWLAFEVLTLASSQFGSSYLAAQSIVLTISSTTFQIPFPISVAASTRVANLIGAKLVGAAKTAAKVSFCFSCIIAVLNFVLLAALRFELAKLFTADPEVIEFVGQILPLVAFMQIFDSLAAMSHGLLRGIGKQHFGSYTNLGAYYIIALPISFGLAFGLDWKLEGLWTGVTIGLFLVAVVEYWYICWSDWDQSVRDAERRNASV